MNAITVLKKEGLKLYIATALAFTVVGVIIALDEILDLPHLLFGAPATEINWAEVAIESVFVFTIFVISIYSLKYLLSRFKATLERLEEAEQDIANVWKRREGILDGIPDPTITIAPNGRITYINEAALKLTGYTKEEALGAKCYKIFRPKDFDENICVRDQCLMVKIPENELSIKNIERTIIAKDGTEIEGVMSCARVKDENGNILGGMEVFRDLREEHRRLREIEESENELAVMNEELKTANEDLNESYIELKEKEDALLKANEELKATQMRIERQREIIESYGKVIAILNSEIELTPLIKKTLDGVMKFTGSQIGRVYLYDAENGILRLHTSFGVSDNGNRELKIGEGLVGEAARKRKPVVLENNLEGYEISALDGSISLKQIICIPVIYQDDLLAVVELGSVDKIDEDITMFAGDFAIQYATAIKNAMAYSSIEELAKELSERNREIEEANRKIQRADNLKSEFLARVSHELRTPMTSILGFTKRVMKKSEGILPEKELKQLEIVYRNAQELLKMINDLLDLAKIESGEIELDITQFDLKDLVDESVDLARPLAEEKGLEIVEKAESIMMTSDRAKIKEMLVNLIGNAIKFTEEGSVNIITEAQNEHICLIVEDTGVGIKEEDIDCIFDEFKQVGCGSQKQHGTGLGLPITKKYAEMLGGGITVESMVGRGTKFTIQIQKDLQKGEI